MTTPKSVRNQHIKVISRAADILRALGGSSGGMSLGQIARDVNLPRSTVQRIVGSLASEGFVATSGGHGRLRLGPQIEALAAARTVRPGAWLRPIMQQISKETGETVDLAILAERRMLFVDQIVGGQRLRAVSSIGESFPLTTTANGKAALACLSELDATEQALRELKSSEARGPGLTELLTELAEIRASGIATDEDEHTSGISAMGFGVIDDSGEVFSVSVPVPSSRYGLVKTKIVAALRRARDRAGRS